jgi:hypothetical protein
MIDTFGLAISHGLMLLAAWRLIFRADLDDEAVPEPDPKTNRHQGFKRFLKARTDA